MDTDDEVPEDAPVIDPPKMVMDKKPLKVICGNCKEPVITQLVHENGHCAYICALFLCVTGVCTFCCCLPLIPGVTPCKDVHHLCPKCGVELGTFHKNYLKEI